VITPETVVALAIRKCTVLDQLGEALRSDLLTANPYLRRTVEFADDFLVERRKLPAATAHALAETRQPQKTLPGDGGIEMSPAAILKALDDMECAAK
jgi:hypothetical protein